MVDGRISEKYDRILAVNLGKILVVGAAEAGKSTLISALCPGAMNLAVNGRTVAMDHATLTRGEHRLSLVGVPGQRRFGPVREVLSAGAWGAVWVHRAGRPMDRETVDLVEEMAGQGVRYLVVVNHDGTVGGENGWRQPPDLPLPTTLIEADLLRPGDELSDLRHEIWGLVNGFEGTKGA